MLNCKVVGMMKYYEFEKERKGFARLFNDVFNDGDDKVLEAIGISKYAKIDSIEYQSAKQICHMNFNYWLTKSLAVDTEIGVQYKDIDDETYEKHLTLENFGESLRLQIKERKKNREKYEREREERISRVGVIEDENTPPTDNTPKKETDNHKQHVCNKDTRSFSDYLHHDNVDSLMVKLRRLLCGKKSKQVAIVLKALIELCILLETDRCNALYEAMREEFGEIGSNSGLNDFFNQSRSAHTILGTDVDAVIEVLKRS